MHMHKTVRHDSCMHSDSVSQLEDPSSLTQGCCLPSAGLQCQGSIPRGTWLLVSHKEQLKEGKLVRTQLCTGTRVGFLLPEQ